MRETITLDFDGVIHAYITPWVSADVIPDDAIDGAIDWMFTAMSEYDLAILSARSTQDGGIPAMRAWLKKELIDWLTDTGSISATLEKYELAGFHPETTQLDYEMSVWADGIINRIQWPTSKIPSCLYIDDNGYRFEGRWPRLSEIAKMDSWVKNK